jgi:hypothetical protein
VLKVNDKVKITKTGEVGYVEKLSDEGERITVRIPASEGWPFQHYVFISKEGLIYLNDKAKSKPESKPLDWRAPF